jgi:hypothetical protein
LEKHNLKLQNIISNLSDIKFGNSVKVGPIWVVLVNNELLSFYPKGGKSPAVHIHTIVSPFDINYYPKNNIKKLRNNIVIIGLLL